MMLRLNRETDPAKSFRKVLREEIEKPVPDSFKRTVSTGSTLLDLAISGGRVRGGGIPGGKIVEISGPPAAGKTALAMEILASAQARGGDGMVMDPEGRLDEEYSTIYGVKINKKNYSMPDLVPDVFETIREWEPKPQKEEAINVLVVDSLAALSTELEMSKDGDKRGQRRAKEFSEELRKTCRVINRKNILLVATNQEREGDSGPVTPGGKGFPFYSSLRVRVFPQFRDWKIEREKEFQGKKIKKQIGVISTCRVIKSSIDDPFRDANIYLIWNFGISDIMGSLQYYKDIMNIGRYLVVDKGFQAMDQAVKYIEENGLEVKLREMVIDLWLEVQKTFTIDRKPKVRI